MGLFSSPAIRLNWWAMSNSRMLRGPRHGWYSTFSRTALNHTAHWTPGCTIVASRSLKKAKRIHYSWSAYDLNLESMDFSQPNLCQTTDLTTSKWISRGKWVDKTAVIKEKKTTSMTEALPENKFATKTVQYLIVFLYHVTSKAFLWLKPLCTSITREINTRMFCHVVIIVAFTSKALLARLAPIWEATRMELHMNMKSTVARVNFPTFFAWKSFRVCRVGLYLPGASCGRCETYTPWSGYHLSISSTPRL